MDSREDAERNPERVALEAVETPDGRLVVQAEGSVWQFYFPAGKTPTEDQMRIAVGALGAVKTMQAGNVAYTGWDASADGVTTDVLNFTGQSIIDASARADAVENARRAEAFNERVETEVERLVSEKAAVLESASSERIQGYEQDAIDATQRAQSAEADRKATLLELDALIEESATLRRVLDASGITQEDIEAIRNEDSENSVLPDEGEPIIVEGGEGDIVTNVEYPETTVRGEERKA